MSGLGGKKTVTITKKVTIWTMLLIIFTVIASFSINLYITWERTLEDKYTEAKSISVLLDQRLETTYDALIANSTLSKEEKIAVLNEQLQPLIDDITQAYPNFGSGYYVKELDSIVAFGPDFNESGLKDISKDSQARQVYITGENIEFHNHSQTRGSYVVANIHPIIRDGEIIGHSWGNVPMDDVFTLFKNDFRSLIMILLTMLIIAVVGARLITKQYTNNLKLFKEHILHDIELSGNTGFTKELSEIYDVYSKSRKALLESEHRFKDVVNSFDEFVWEIDVNGNYLYVSDRVHAILGYDPQDLVGLSKYELMPEEDRIICRALFEECLELKTGFRDFQYKKFTKNGEIKTLSSNCLVLLNDSKEVVGFRGATRDISIQKQHEQAIQHLAYFDSLTNLPNRTSLNKDLQQFITENKPFAVLFIDLDQFKTVNDTLGHQVGDELIKTVSSRLQSALMKHDRIYRFGGDEFIVILRNIENREQLESRAQQLLHITTAPMILNNQPYYTTISIGISLFQEHATSFDELIRYADLAMYKAKEQGKNQYSFFEKSLDIKVGEHFEISNLMIEALTENQFELYYQPQVSLDTGKVTGIEALARWNHPEKGFISPAKFIPIAEENGLIVQLGQYILYEACKIRKAWLDEGLETIRIAVNISLKQFQQPDFIERVLSILEETGLEGRYLELEITESIAMDAPNLVIEKLKKFQEYNIHISIDDFGMGYSSLNYLKQLPIHQLKIDRAFVQDIDQNNDYAIVKSIITMAEILALEVVAEGVETVVQADLLRDMSCPIAQGYLFYKPMPASEIIDNVKQKI